MPLPFSPMDIVKAIWVTVQEVQTMKNQLKNLAATVAHLLQTLDWEHRSRRIVDSANTVWEINSLDNLLFEIKNFITSQASSNFLKVLYRHNDTILAIENFHHRIATIVNAFNITSLLNVQEWQVQSTKARIEDQDALNAKLSSLESNQNQLAELLNSQHSSVMAMMISLQRSLEKQTAMSAQQRKFMSHSLNYLASTSQEQIRIDSWTVTSFEVEFGREIGSGGFGQVYEGIWNKTPVALKVLRAEAGAIPNAAMMRREIETWANLRHPHVLQFLGANILDDKPFIVMPYLKNGNARDYTQSHPSCDRVKILYHVSLGLVHLHLQKIIHGDLKALNILIDDAENAILCDFGLSRVKAETTSRTANPGGGSVAGSRNWMSPERLNGGNLREPVDIYAFGMTVYEIFTSEIPLGHLDYGDFFDLVVNRNVRPERPEVDEVPGLPDELWELAERCWTKDPKVRPNAATVCDEMARCLTLPRSGVSNVVISSSPIPISRPLPAADSSGSSTSGSRRLPIPPLSTSPSSNNGILVPNRALSVSQRSPTVQRPSLGIPSVPPGPTVLDRRRTLPTFPRTDGLTSNSSQSFNGRVRALYDYKPKTVNELPLVKDEILVFLDIKDDNWWVLRKGNGAEGIAPSNYLQPLTPNIGGSSEPNATFAVRPPVSRTVHTQPMLLRAKALYNYKANTEDKYEISFVKGEVMEVLDKQEKWWIVRKSDRTEGIVPSNYLQPL